MSEQVGSREGTTQAAWEQAWIEKYAPHAEAARSRLAAHRPGRARARLRELIITTTVLAGSVASVSLAETGSDLTTARGEGDPVALGERNPGSGESTRETAIVVNAGSGGLALRPSNTAKGGRAVSATCDNDGQTEEDGCAVYVNKGTGAAASFRTNGSVPFALRNTNTGLVQFLNADMVDGRSAADFLGRSERAADSANLAGSPPSAFLGTTAKAADAESVDGMDSTAFLGATAKAADAESVDGLDSAAFLGATAKAADANTLDGVESDDFTRVSGAVFANGNPAALGFTVNKTGTGVYQVALDAGTFPNSGTSCSTLFPVASALGADPRTAVVDSTGCTVGGGGTFTVRTFNAAAPADAAFTFIADARP